MMSLTRRQFVLAVGAAGASLTMGGSIGLAQEVGFTLPKLPYPADALEPHIDAKTMTIHHDLHHGAYVKNLNTALKDSPELMKMPIEQILRDIKKVPEKVRQAVVNNGGGHANHTLFWEIMAKDGGGNPTGELAKAIEKDLGGIEQCKKAVSQAGITQFGSGWGWIVVEKKALKVRPSANQDSPLMDGQTPILGIDVWEHAYYLKYQNLRPKYVEAWWNVVNWKAVADRYAAAMKG